MEPKKKIMCEEKIQIRVKAWESVYGAVPPDATHMHLIGYIAERDVKKVGANGEVLHWEAGHWRKTTWTPKEIIGSALFAEINKPEAVEAISEPHPRIAEWKARYGEIPSGATHLFLHGPLSVADVKRVKRDGTVFRWWRNKEWMKSNLSLKDIQERQHLFAKLRPAATDHEQPVEIKHPRIIEWEAEFGSLPEGITHLHTGEFLNLSNAKKVRPDGVVCYWDGK